MSDSLYRYKIQQRKELAKMLLPKDSEFSHARKVRRALLYRLCFSRCLDIRDYSKLQHPSSMDSKILGMYGRFLKKREKDNITSQETFEELKKDGFDYMNVDITNYKCTYRPTGELKKSGLAETTERVLEELGAPNQDVSAESILNTVKSAVVNFAEDNPVWANIGFKIVQQEHPKYRDVSHQTFTPEDYKVILEDLDKGLDERLLRVVGADKIEQVFTSYEVKNEGITKLESSD